MAVIVEQRLGLSMIATQRSAIISGRSSLRLRLAKRCMISASGTRNSRATFNAQPKFARQSSRDWAWAKVRGNHRTGIPVYSPAIQSFAGDFDDDGIGDQLAAGHVLVGSCPSGVWSWMAWRSMSPVER